MGESRRVSIALSFLTPRVGPVVGPRVDRTKVCTVLGVLVDIHR